MARSSKRKSSTSSSAKSTKTTTTRGRRSSKGTAASTSSTRSKRKRRQQLEQEHDNGEENNEEVEEEVAEEEENDVDNDNENDIDIAEEEIVQGVEAEIEETMEQADEDDVEHDDNEENSDESECNNDNEDDVVAAEPNNDEEQNDNENDENNDENNVEENEDDNEDNTAPAARRSINKPGQPPEAGVIQSVYMENFMCHRKLQVDLCRNVNFINGQNGSGKSAILAAVQICLGAGARRTNRARNLKDLVRKDGSAGSIAMGAKVRVTLLNGGNDAYKPDVYGNSITVERCISLSGGGYNGFKLLDSNLVEKSRSKKDLEDMLDMLNIQVDNPVSILDQEEAKKFLMGKGKDKYNFFMKATELERCDQKYAMIIFKIQELATVQEKVEESLAPATERIKQLKVRYEQHLVVDQLEQKVVELQLKYAWAYHQVVDQEYQAAEADRDLFEAKAKKKQEELAQAEEVANQPDDEQLSRQTKINELVAEAQEQAALKQQVELQLKEALLPQKKLERQLHIFKKQKNAIQKELDAARNRLKEARDQVLQQAGGQQTEQARRAAALAQAEDDLATARSKVPQLKEAVSKAYRQHEEMEPQLVEARNRAKHVAGRVEGAKANLRRLQHSGADDEFAPLGPRVKLVHDNVQIAIRQGKFKGRVVGPLAKYIKIKAGKEKYAGIAELALGYGTLDRFILTDARDRSVMNAIRQAAGCRRDCDLFVVKEFGNRYPIPGPPTAEIETIASVLNVTEDIVFNTLVDQCRIECKALADNREKSEEKLLYCDERGDDKIVGAISEVYCLPSGDYWTVRNGTKALFSNEKQIRKTLGVDQREAIAEAEQDVQELEDELKELKREEGRLEVEHTGYRREWNKAQKENQLNETLINDLGIKIDELRSEMETTASVEIDTTEYEDDVAQQESELDNLNQEDEKIRVELEELAPNIEDLKRKVNEVAGRSEKVLKDMETAQQELTQHLLTQNQTQEKIEKKRKKLEQYLEISKKKQEVLDGLLERKNDALGKARLLHYNFLMRKEMLEASSTNGGLAAAAGTQTSIPEPSEEELEKIEPIQVSKNMDYYEAKIKNAQEILTRERERRDIATEDRDEAYEKYIRAKELLQSKLDQFEEMNAHIMELQEDVKTRRIRWKQIRKALERKIPVKFNDLLQLNNQSGRITFDHEGKSLELEVQKGTESNEQATKDVKGLSGGERSYTTMCLLLSLGEYLETPFRILDEFDVFLDPQARKLTMQLLVHTAKQMEHRQFIFITPQDLGSLRPDRKLKIFKLSPPEKRTMAGGPSQTTLSFSQHNNASS